MSALNVNMLVTDPLYVRNVNGIAIMPTRTTARTVLKKLADNDYPVEGYVAKRVEVKVEVVG